MAKARQQYFADEVTLQKENRDFAIQPELVEKLESIEAGAQVNVIETVKVNGEALTPDENKAVDVSVPLVEDTLYSTDPDKALSANQGKVLYEYIQNLASRGRYLSNWNAVTGLPTTSPVDNPYQYRAGDYYVVSNVAAEGGTNYRPDGSSYSWGTASTTVETETVKVGDYYTYDGQHWLLLVNTEREIAVDSSLSTTSTNPVENRVVTNALNTKQNNITDLETIRSGAALGATALQPGDSLSELTGTSDDITQGATNLFMTTAERSKLSNQSGVNTGDETQTTIKNKLGQASTSTDGYLTSTDWNTFNNKQGAISDLETIRSNASAGKNASDTIATYGDIVTHDVSEFATSAQGGLADTAIQPGDNVSELTNDAGYVTDAYHDDTKQDKLIAGANIQIAADGKTISATDTIYVAGDFDIKDLADSTGLRAEWSGKQDELIAGNNIQIAADGKTISSTDTTYTAGPGISISNNNVISNTQTSAEWGNIQGTLSNQTDLQDVLDAKQDELTAGDNVSIEEVCVDISDMKGPAPSGFHVPLQTERQAVADAYTDLGLSGGDNFRIYLKLPFAGRRSDSSADVDSQGIYGYYWSSSRDFADYAYLLSLNSSSLGPQYSYYCAAGFSVRCFKDSPETPDSSWTTLYDGSSIATGAGIFHNATDGLISISSDGTTWYTIQDKNLGATTVYNDGDTLSEANCGAYFQRGNNYGFAWTGSVTTSSTQVDASGYGPGNYYSSSTFIIYNEDWSSVQNDNLWGGVSQGSTQECALTISSTDTKYTAGTGISIDANNVISNTQTSAEWGNIIGTLSDQTDLQSALNDKQDELIAGANIQIAADGKTISAINTEYTASDFDIKDLADSTGKRASWDAKQDAISDLATIRNNASTAIQPNDNVSELTNDAGYITSADIPALDTAMSSTSTNGVQNKVIKSYVDTQVQEATSGAVSDTAYGSSWDGVTGIAPSKNAVYDKISAMDTTIAGKQDTISDLSTIRTGAGKGATAVQPGDNVSTLTNDAGFITNAVNDLTNYYTKSETYTKAEVADYVANFAGFKVVATLPTTDIKTTIIYLLGPLGTGADKYEEYIYSNNAWVKIGETSVDLTNYFNTSTDNSDNITEGSTNLFLTSTERTKLSNTSGTNTGDETKATIQSKLGAATSSNDGYLTSADWSTFNGKANAADVNTKTFELTGTTDTTNALKVVNWYKAGNTPIIKLNNSGLIDMYYLKEVSIIGEISGNRYMMDFYSKTIVGNRVEKLEIYTNVGATAITSIETSTSALYNAGTGIGINNNTITNTGVLSVNGQTGDVTIDMSNYLAKDNTTSFTPTGDYNPATKKYVDDSVSGKANASDITVKAYVTNGTMDAQTFMAMMNGLVQNGIAPIIIYNLEQYYYERAASSSTAITFYFYAPSNGVSSGTLYNKRLTVSMAIQTAEVTITQSNENLALGSGDMSYSDFGWQAKTGATITLDLASTYTPSANFTVNAPSTIKDGQTYILRVDNGATAYTMTLGTNVTNPFDTDITLTANGVDQFVFLAIGGALELQPEGGGGGIVSAANSPINVKYIWAGTEAQYEALSSYDDNTVYLTV